LDQDDRARTWNWVSQYPTWTLEAKTIVLVRPADRNQSTLMWNNQMRPKMEASHPTDVDHGNKSQLRRSWKFLQNAKELNITNTQPATSHHMHITQTGVGGNNHTLSQHLQPEVKRFILRPSWFHFKSKTWFTPKASPMRTTGEQTAKWTNKLMRRDERLKWEWRVETGVGCGMCEGGRLSFFPN
jgi:hypothetical protein